MGLRLVRSAKLYLVYLALCVLTLLLMRVAFFLTFGRGVAGVLSQDLWRAAYLGAKFDVRLAAFMSLPLGLLLSIPKTTFFGSPGLQKAAKILSTAFFALIMCIYFFDFGFFGYLDTRLSVAGFKFFENPLISLGMLNESYPLFWIVFGYFALVVGHYWLLGILIRRGMAYSPPVSKKIKSFNFSFCFILMMLCIYGKFAYYPLRWSEAYFSTHSFVSNFALNPALYLYETAKFAKHDYDIEKTRSYYPTVARFLGVDKPNAKRLSYVRRVSGQTLPQQPNVVIILLESLAADKTSIFGNKLDPTPFLASLAKESLLFTKFFTPTEATARGVFASITGIPDVSIVKTSTRNPFVVNQNTIVNQFTDYEKFYFLGGSANWGNIRGIISHNIDGVKIYEEGSFAAAHNDVWGISDLELFKEADSVFAKQSKPFISFIQTAGFHRPYTIPKGAEDFELAKFDSKTLEENSFYSLDQLNSLRFEDFSLEKFFEMARKSPYFENTIFIMLGDHGLPATKSPNAPPGFNFYKLIAHHTPLLIYAPKWVKPGVSDRVVSQVDVVATAASLAGQSFTNTTLGRNILALKGGEPSYAFLYSWHELPPKISLVGADYYYVDSPQLKGLYLHSDPDFKKDWSAEKPEILKEMSDLARGLYYTSQYMLYNNPKL